MMVGADSDSWILIRSTLSAGFGYYIQLGMRDNEAEPDSNDFLVLPGSNRNPPKSNVLARANQIRAALQSVDNEQLPHH